MRMCRVAQALAKAAPSDRRVTQVLCFVGSQSELLRKVVDNRLSFDASSWRRFEHLEYASEDSQSQQLGAKQRFLLMDIGRQELLSELGQQNPLFGRLQKIEHFAGHDDGQRVAEVVTFPAMQFEHVHLVAVIMDNFHQAENLADRNGRDRFERARFGHRPDRRRKIGQVFGNDDLV